MTSRQSPTKTGAFSDQNPGVSHAEVVTGVEFLLQMVETHRSRRNGTGMMETDSRAEAELAQIEKQLEQLKLTPGQSEDTRRQIQELHDRIDALRNDVHSGLTAWE